MALKLQAISATSVVLLSPLRQRPTLSFPVYTSHHKTSKNYTQQQPIFAYYYSTVRAPIQLFLSTSRQYLPKSHKKITVINANYGRLVCMLQSSTSLQTRQFTTKLGNDFNLPKNCKKSMGTPITTNFHLNQRFVHLSAAQQASLKESTIISSTTPS